MNKIITIILTCFVLSASCFGAEIYVDVNAIGSATGADWTNAYTSLQTAENNCSRGDTIYIAEGTYSESVTFDTAESGTTVITVSKCGTDDSTCTAAAGYNAEDHDDQAIFYSTGTNWTISTGYWTFDGVTGGGPGAWDSGHGIKISNTATSGARRGISCAVDADNIEIKRLEFDMGGNTDLSSAFGILASYSPGNLTGWLIQRCYLHDSNGANIITKGHDGLIAEYNLFARNFSDAAYHGEAWTAEYDDNIIVRYNIFEDNHGSGIIFFKVNGNCSPAMDGWQIYGNLFWWSPTYRNIPKYEDTATGGDVYTMIDTAASFPVDDSLVGSSISNPTDGSTVSCTITSNTATTITCSGGLMNGGSWDSGDTYKISRAAGAGVVGRGGENDTGCDDSAGAVNNLMFVNNTIAYVNYGCWNGSQKLCAASSATINFSEGSGNISKNNIVLSSVGESTDWANITASYNWYYDISKASGADKTSTVVAAESNGQEGVGDPFSDSDSRDGFWLLAATNAGDSTIGATYNTDADGKTRGADGVWDRGAYEYQALGTPPSLDNSPVSIGDGVVTIGN